MGGNAVGEPLFSMATAMLRSTDHLSFLTNMSFQSQAFNFSTFFQKEEMSGSSQKSREEEIDSRSGGSGNMDAGSGEDQDDHSRKKRYHRHTAKQIQRMEALFQQNPHPDDKDRLKLSQELGLKPRQVKFWFQNRRTQLKAQQDRADNAVLRTENENLKSENLRLQTAMRNLSCATCGGPANAILGDLSYDVQHLRLENTRLREELDRICSMTSRYSSRRPSIFSSVHPGAMQPPAVQPSLDLDMGVYSRHFQESMPSSSEIIAPIPVPESPAIGLLESEKPVAIDLAMCATDHLLRMSQCGEPLWLRLGEGDQEREVLNPEEHARAFPWPVGGLRQRLGNYRTEASRDSALVTMNAVNLVSAFVDANKWVEMFPSIVARARTIQIITPGLGSHVNGSLQLMHAEFQFPSPLVPTRECYFLRFCSQQGGDGIWVVVDFPVDGFHDATIQSPSATTSLFPRYRRRVSGVIVQDVPNGYSKVTWVEHAEVAEDRPQHQIFNQVVLSGAAYGARRWVANLQRHCERVASLMSSNTIDRDLGVTYSIEARRNLMHLARRMVIMFNLSINPAGSWSALMDGSADDTVRIATRKNTEPGQPQGVILCGVSSTWLPLSHLQVFELLRCEKRRSQMDALSGGNTLQEVAHITNGSHPGNYVSLLRVNAVSNSSSTTADLMMQESYIDASGSAVVYAPIDVAGVNVAMSGEDTSFIPLLPSGFIMVPTGSYFSGDFGNPSTSTLPGHGGCILTAVFQVLASAVPTSNISMATVTALNKHIFNVVRQVHAALGVSSPDLLPSVA